MIFKELYIHNFLSIGEATISLDNRGLLLVQGVNESDTSATSNGAGKSSIVDALCWALYGTTARNVSGDLVVNRTAKKNCTVRVVVEDDSSIYTIERNRKHKTNKNQLFVRVQESAGAPYIDMSKGTDKETQEVVESVIGSSLEVFKSSVYAGQEQMPDLPGMTDKNLKALIEEAAGVEILTEAYAIARAQALTVNGQCASAKTTLTRVDSAIVVAEAELEGHRRRAKEFEDDRRDKAKAKLAEALPFIENLKVHNATLAAVDELALVAELNEVNATLAAVEGENSKLNELNVEHEGLYRKTIAAVMDVRSKKAELDRETAALADIDNMLGKPCGECGKLYEEHDFASVRELRIEKIKNLTTDVLKAAVVAKEAKKLSDDAEAVANAYKASMTNISESLRKQTDLSKKLSDVTSVKRSIEATNAKIDTIKAASKAMLTEANPYQNTVEVEEANLTHQKAEQARLKTQVEELEERLEIANDAVAVFGPAGMRAHILDTVTPFLNERTREYLGAFSDGNISAVWSTLTKNAKGELKEKFSIEAVNNKGAECFAGLSGGEKRKVRLACAMALQDLVASRATKPINLFIGDEIDDAVDEAGLERLMGILESKAKDRGTVLIISHRSLADWISNIITVTKGSDGVATITDDGGM